MINYNIDVIEDPNLSTYYDKRYIIVNKDTGEVIDTAQGYGYKSKQKAYAAFAYKNRDKSKDKEKADRKRYIQKWIKEHSSFMNLLEGYAFDYIKNGDEEDKIDAKFVKELLKSENLTIDFKPSELLNVWQKG